MIIQRIAIGAGLTVAAFTPASASASETPANYGHCVALEAMFDEDPVREFTEFFSPATVVAGMDNLPPGTKGVPIACGTPEG